MNIFLFHREIYNFVGRLMIIIDDSHALLKEVGINDDEFLKLLFILVKTQTNYILSMKDRMTNTTISLFDPYRWKSF